MTSRFSSFPAFLRDADSSSHSSSKVCAILGCAILVVVLVYVLMVLTPAGRGCMGRISARNAPVAAAPTHTEAADDKELESLIKANDKCFVMFYAPWCGHCQTTKPAFKEAASKDPSTKYVLANCSDNISKSTMEKYSVKAFPKMLFFKGGVFSKEFNQARTSDNMKKFCNES